MQTSRKPQQDDARPNRGATTWWRFGRTDVVALRVLIVLGAAAYLGLVLAPQLVRWISGDPLIWLGQVADDGPELPGLAAPGAAVRYADTVEWTIQNATAGQWLASLAPTIITTLILLGGLWFIWKLLSATAHGDPFSGRSLRHVRAIALLVVAYGVLLPFSRPLFGLMVVMPSSTTPEAMSVFTVGDLAPLLIGFLMLAVAECFRIGRELRHDVDGLV
jgi:hypothetical protein